VEEEGGGIKRILLETWDRRKEEGETARCWEESPWISQTGEICCLLPGRGQGHNYSPHRGELNRQFYLIKLKLYTYETLLKIIFIPVLYNIFNL
jgi:hypothetical protein